ncbi:MAG: septum formation initiator family protein [bacterium]|nr:septum formation initiator family protein [bacterium]
MEDYGMEEERDERQEERAKVIDVIVLQLKKFRKIGILLIVLLIGYLLIFRTYGAGKIVMLRWQIWKTEQEINVMRAKRLVIKREIDLLMGSKEYTKKVAKERYGIE